MSQQISGPVSQKLERELSELCASEGVVGASVAAVKGQELVWSTGLGFADLESERPPDDSTVFRVASITKTFTATAIFQLRDRGALSVDDPIARHIPEFSAVQPRKGSVEKVTLRRLLCHHSGLVGEPPGDHWESLDFPTAEEIVSSLPEIELVIEPDSAFKYSNLGFSLLGEVVSRVSGRPYEKYIEAEILRPLDMKSSTFHLTDELRPRMAIGYQSQPDKDRPNVAPHFLVNGTAPAGQLYSTVADLAKWIAFQFTANGTERGSVEVLSPASLREMHRPQFLEPGWDTGYCLPWTAFRYSSDVYLSHRGALHGFLSNIAFSPERRIGAVALTNLDGHEVAPQIVRRVIETLAETDASKPEPAESRTPDATPDEWREFLGTYAGVVSWLTRIEYRQGSLQMLLPQGGSPIALRPTRDLDVFVPAAGRSAGEELRFRRDERGSVTGFTAGGFPNDKLIEAGPGDARAKGRKASG